MKRLVSILLILGLNSLNAATLKVSTYFASKGNDIVVHYEKDKGECHPENRPEDAKDWIAIYKKGTSSAWKNVIKWAWVKDLKGYAPCDEDHVYSNALIGLVNGDYEARLFKNNSYVVNTSLTFNVKDNSNSYEANLKLIPKNKIYPSMIQILYKNEKECSPTNRAENATDWIGIFKKGTSSAAENVIKWAWVKDLSGIAPCDVGHEYLNYKKDLSNGTYEARFFKHNSYVVNKSLEFNVKNENQSIIDKARKHCVPGYKPDSLLLCSNERTNQHRIAYAIDYKEQSVISSKYDFVRIDITDNTTEIISADYLLLDFEYVFLSYLKYTPIYVFQKINNHADRNKLWEFKYKKKTILSFGSTEGYGVVVDYKQTNKGKNLVIVRTYHFDDPANTYNKVFILTYLI